MYSAADYLDLSQSDHRALFEKTHQVWDALKQLATYLEFWLRPQFLGRVIGQPYIGEAVFVGEGTIVEHGAMIKGPAWIGQNCHVRTGCYIRENVVIGNDVVLGNSCEFKNSLVFNRAEIPHFSYVGDSILGYRAHLAAGVILSNVRLDRQEIVVRNGSERIETGLRKFGAVIGDHAEVGCNTVISPGSLIGRHALIYPLSHFAGVLPENSILKIRQNQEVVKRSQDL